MRHSRTEVSHWRMQRQKARHRGLRLKIQSARNHQLHGVRILRRLDHRRTLLYTMIYEW